MQGLNKIIKMIRILFKSEYPKIDVFVFFLSRIFKYKIKFSISGIHFFENNKILWRQVYEIFFLKEYEKTGVFLNDKDIVLDIGANLGVFMVYSFMKGVKKIYCVEPSPENIKSIQKLLTVNNITNVEIIPKLVSDSLESKKLYMSQRHTRHSILSEEVLTQKTLDNFILVESTTLSQLLSIYKDISFIKMDCEGAEYLIFSCISTEDLSNIESISMEYHIYQSTKDFEELENKLINLGYELRITPHPNLKTGILIAKKRSS